MGKFKSNKPTGFAALSPERRREIASSGGKAVHAKGLAPLFTRESARVNGRKGGKAVSADPAYMMELGRRGGLKSAELRKKKREQDKIH